MYEIRPLTAADAAAFRALRLEMLERHPTSFGTALEEDAQRSVDDFAARFEQISAFGGFEGDGLCGIIGLAPQRRAKVRHKASIIMVYVTPRARGRGLAGALVGRVIDYAGGRFEILQLTVNATNHAARRLYDRHGFIPYGTEPRSLKVDGAYHDEVLMYRLIEPVT